MKNKQHIFDNPKNVKLLIRILFVSCFILFAMDLFIHRHTVHPWESFIGFYGIYGFLSCVILVLLARELRKLVMRDEDYYKTLDIPADDPKTQDDKTIQKERRTQDRRGQDRRAQGDRRKSDRRDNEDRRKR